MADRLASTSRGVCASWMAALRTTTTMSASMRGWVA